MALNNSIAATKKTANDKVVDFKCGEEVVRLSPNIIRKYLVNGNGAVTDQEIVMFLNLCRFQHLNPFLREAYLLLKVPQSDSSSWWIFHRQDHPAAV